jgi:site-specific DNA recombinase
MNLPLPLIMLKVILEGRLEMMKYEVAVYCRLSQDDKDKSISNSIVNQQKILMRYISNHEDLEYKETYIDDGFTGTNFSRPGFERMIRDIDNGKITCVIVKDLSRFGREHITVDNYLENIFPLNGVRFISLTENIDSYKNPQKMQSIEIPFRNLLNEEYAKDISRKTRASLESKRRQGKYVGNSTPYGFIKDPNDKNKLLIDKIASKVVYQIFVWFIEGLNQTQIANKLNSMNVLCPMAHKVNLGIAKKPKNANEDTFDTWSNSKVRDILWNEIYTGNLVQGKTTSISHKIKRRDPLPRDEWTIVENTHEAIIDADMFDSVKKLLKKRTKPNRVEPSILAGIIVCGKCGKIMFRSTSTSKGIKYTRFVCSTRRRYGKSACNSHIINEEILVDVLLEMINVQIVRAVNFDKLIKQMERDDLAAKEIVFYEKKYEQVETRQDDIFILLNGLYKDYKNGIISKDEYRAFKEDYEQSLEAVPEELSSINEKISELKSKKCGVNEFVRNFRKHKQVTQLDRMLIISLVENIVVDNYREITINFKFQDEYKKMEAILAKEA